MAGWGYFAFQDGKNSMHSFSTITVVFAVVECKAMLSSESS